MDRSLPLDSLDSRVVLLGYALVITPVGLFIALWGNAWVGGALNGLPYGVDSLTRMIGVVILGAGLVAYALSQISNAWERRRALLWFTIAHAVVLLMAFLQSVAIWSASTNRVLYWLVGAVGSAALWLFFGWQRQAGDPPPYSLYQSLFRPRPESATQRLRSEYEQQMRAVGAQEERNRLARDLHDSVKQQLFAIQAAAATAEARFTQDPTGSHEAISRIRDAGRDAMAEMEAMLEQLRATPTENAGLVSALRQQCEALRLRTGATVACEIGALPPNAALPPGVHLAMFRVAQEALSNVARHARASRVTVRLERVGGQLQLAVIDDGSGFDQATIQGGMGLENIRQRAIDLGGEAHIGSRPGEGTTVLVSIPFIDGNPGYFLRQAGWRLLGIGLAAFMAIGTRANGPNHSPSPMAFFAMLFAVDLVRYLVAWRRATRLRSAAS